MRGPAFLVLVFYLKEKRKGACDHTNNHHTTNNDAVNTIVALPVISKHAKHIKNILSRMNDYRKPQTSHDIARFFAGVGVVLVLFAISTVAVKAAYGMYQTFSVAAVEADGAAAELTALQTQYAQVNATLASLGTSRGVEQAVRERFGVVKPGEGEIRIVRDQGVTETDTGDEERNTFMQFFQSLLVW